MKLAYSSNGFTRVDLPTAIRRIAAHGYAGVELLADTPHWAPPSVGGFALAPVLAALRQSGLAVSNVNANTAVALWEEPPPEPVFEPSLSHHDPDVRTRRLAYSVAALELAAAVGAPAISVTSGRTEADVPPERGLAFFADSLRRLCLRAETYGVRVGIEYEPGLLVEHAAEVRALIEQVDHPLLGVNLDIGHAICAGEDPGEAIRLLAGRIWNVHLEDIRGRKHYHLVPGEGDVDFARVLAQLHEIGYDGFVTVELYTCSARADEAASRAFAHLAPHLRALEGSRSVASA